MAAAAQGLQSRRITPVNSAGQTGVPATLAVTVGAAVGSAGSITGNQTITVGSAGNTYSISAVSGVGGSTPYLWTAPSGANIVSGQGTTSIIVDYGCGASSGSVTVTPENANGCTGTAATLAITVSGAVGTAGSITGTSTVTVGNSIPYSISSVSRRFLYDWTLPSGAIITSAGAGSVSITVAYGCSAASGNAQVTPIGANGCAGTASPTFAVTVSGAVSAAGSITGTATPTPGDTADTYSISSVTGATTYNWTVPTGATITSGQGGTSIMVSFPCTLAGFGAITVTPANSGGCTGTASSKTITETLVGPAGPIDGLTSVNPGQSSVKYLIVGVSGATTYTWTVPTGATIASGAGTTTILVNYGCSAVSGNVTVTPGNANSCSGTSASLPVTVGAQVAAAGSITGPSSLAAGAQSQTYSITAVSGVGGGTPYVWTVPAGATIASGQNTTSITVNYSCSASSGNVQVTPTGRWRSNT